MKVTDEELEAMKPTLQALIPILCDDPAGFEGGRWSLNFDGTVACTCVQPDKPCGDRWRCKARPEKWKEEIRKRLNI